MSTRFPSSRQTSILLGLFAACLVIMIVLYPDQAFRSSLDGLTLWWKFVFPALLPFFILSELCIGFGLIHGLGTLLEPLMRRLFGVPGAGGWALAAGLAGGQPVGAKIASQLRANQLLTQTEGERVLAISHLCNPVFLVTLVGAGFLQSPQLGLVLALIHYLSAIITGISLRWFTPHTSAPTRERVPQISLWRRTLSSVSEAHAKDGRTFGKLLGESVNSSLQSLMMIGGLIMIFSVLLSLIKLTGLTMDLPWIQRTLQGLLEIHVGSHSMSSASITPAAIQLALIGAVLGWSGLASHAQVKSLLTGTDLRYSIFLLSRVIHGCLAYVITLIGWPIINRWLAIPVFLFADQGESGSANWITGFNAWPFTLSLLGIGGGILVLMLFLSVAVFHRPSKPS